MDDVNFSDPNLNYGEVISSKLKQFVQESLEPSMLLVWIACGVDLFIDYSGYCIEKLKNSLGRALCD